MESEVEATVLKAQRIHTVSIQRRLFLSRKINGQVYY